MSSRLERLTNEGKVIIDFHFETEDYSDDDLHTQSFDWLVDNVVTFLLTRYGYKGSARCEMMQNLTRELSSYVDKSLDDGYYCGDSMDPYVRFE